MARSFDRRVLPDPVLDLVRACQRRVACHLGGGAALSALHLHHRLSADIDLFCHDLAEVRTLVHDLPTIERECGLRVELMRDGGTHVRSTVLGNERGFQLDLVYEAVADIEPPETDVEGVIVESLTDLRVSKLTCLLSRSEPRDLVDLLFLDRGGYPPERDLRLALRKDAGIDPGVLAWLLGEFPVAPLPVMLQPLTSEELRAFRDDLRARFRRIAAGE